MATILNHVVASGEHVSHGRVVAREDPRVQQIVPGPTEQGVVLGVQHDDVGPSSGLQDTDAPAGRGCSSTQRFLEQSTPGRTMVKACCHIPRFRLEALAVLQHPEFTGRAAPHMRIRSDRPSAGVVLERREGKNAIPQVRFGRWAESDHCPGAGHALHLDIVHVRRMDEAPVSIDRRMFQEPGHRTQAAPRDTTVDFALLLRNVDVNRQ